MRGLAAAVAALAVLATAAAPARAAPATSRSHAPVVMVVFDELPVISLLDRRGAVDRVRYPNFAALTQHSTWFRNATTDSDATHYAIPSILDGRGVRSGVPGTFRGHPRNLFTILHRGGYRMYSQEEGTALCPYRSCRRRHGTRYYLQHSRVRRFNDWVAGIEPHKQPTLYFKHALLPHVPWVLLPSGQSYQGSLRSVIPGINSELSVFDPELVHQSYQRHLLQAQAVDTLLGRLIARLKATGIYDRATIVVMADHGVAFNTGVVDRRTLVSRNVGSIVPVPLFIKRPGQRRGSVSRAWVRHTDVLPTLARLTHTRIGYRTRGRDAFSSGVRGRHRLKIASRRAKGALTISTGKLARRKRAVLKRQVRLFGSGAHSIYARGPNARLLFRPLASLRVRPQGGVRTKLVHPERFSKVRLSSTFIPAFVAGRIRGKRGQSTRNLAVAVNGRIRGVTRSFRLRHRKEESFALMIPPAAFRNGANSVEVFQVGKSRRRYVLRRLN
ncbi:MAG: sulfatase-like hydrolase/transferase [Thermoleophilaceae bacterium]